MTRTHELEARVGALVKGWRTGARLQSLRPLIGGSSSLTFVAEVGSPDRGTERIVVKVAPPGLEPVRNRDVLRQARLLRGLHGHPGVTVPIVLFEDAGTPVDIPPLFAMTFLEGESVEPNIDQDVEGNLPPPAVLTERAHSAARVLAALHSVEPEKAGFADEPVVSAADEIERWAKALATVPTEVLGGRDDCADRLRESLPEAVPSRLIHGDFRLGNCLAVGSEVRAVIDWEIWARSDPRIDLAWFLIIADPTHPSAQRRAVGMPAPHELLDAYLAAGGPAAPELQWFTALMLYKLTAVCGLIAKNAIKRGDRAALGTVAAVPAMLARAREVIVR